MGNTTEQADFIVRGNEKLVVTKMDVARRQLATAIRLWFNDDDPISIHTLVFAAHEVAHRLYREKGLADLLFDSSIVNEERRKEYSLMLKESAWFFKHADRGQSNATHEFQTGRNLLFLLMTAVAMGRMFEDLNDEESIFMYWLRVHQPSWFNEEKSPIPPNELAKITPMSKQEFFSHVLGVRVRYRRA